MFETIAVLIMLAAMALMAIAAWDACNGFVLRWGRLFIAAGILIAVAFLASPARSHDHNRPELDGWYSSLMQPDNPNVSCCGIADAYWCDEIHVKDGKTFCTITDDRDDAPLGRPHVPMGTVIEIPNHKLKWDRGNPTGHHVVFLSSGGLVFCFVQSSGS
jgi:hypothetical protein